MTTRHTQFQLVLFGVGVFALPCVALSADLQPKTVAAFDRYVAATEAVIDAPGAPALWIDTLPRARRQEVDDLLHSGQVVVDRTSTKTAFATSRSPAAWSITGSARCSCPACTVRTPSRCCRTTIAMRDVYAPAVQRSRLLSRDGDRFKVFLRFYQKKVITVVVNSEHEAHLLAAAGRACRSRIRSTRIAEVERPGKPTEREKPVGKTAATCGGSTPTGGSSSAAAGSTSSASR